MALQTNTVTVPTAGRDKTEQVRRRNRLWEPGNMAEHKHDCLQSKPPTLEKALEGTSQSCHLVTNTLSHYYLCCWIAFILLCCGENHCTENKSSHTFREIKLQFQTSPQKWIIKQGFWAQHTAFVMPSGSLPENTLSRQQTEEHPEKTWSWDPAKQLIELVTQKKQQKGCQCQIFPQAT